MAAISAVFILFIVVALCLLVLLVAGGLVAYMIMLDRHRGAPRDPDQEAR